MNGSRVANRYAKAMFDYATEKQMLQVVFSDMSLIHSVLQENTELKAVLLSPVIKSSVKKNILFEIFKDVSSLTLKMMEVLINNRRISILNLVVEKFIDYYNEEEGFKKAVVITAIPITSQIEQQVIDKISELGYKQKFTIHNVVDTSIIGGFILRIDDLQYNASILNQINQYKQGIVKKSLVLN